MRWSAVVALAAALAALIVADLLAPAAEPEPPAADTSPVVAYRGGGVPGDDNAGGSTWFCAGGVGGLAGSIQEIVIVNTAAHDLPARLRFYPAVPRGGRSRHWPPVRSEVVVAPQSRFAVAATGTVMGAMADLSTFEEIFVATEVAFDAPGGVVLQKVTVDGASDISPCLTAASPTWHFAIASTRRDARARLGLLNPYADDAVVDVSFVTDEGRREPVAYQGIVVPAGALEVLDLGSEVTRRAQVSFSVVARSGNLLAASLQTFNGDLGLAGVALRAGEPRPATQWLFPLGIAGAAHGAANSFVLYNPNDAEARVDLALKLDASLRARGLPPFELTVPARRRVEVVFRPPGAPDEHPTSGTDLTEAAGRVLPSERYWVSVRSFNGVGVVAERLRTASGGAMEAGGIAVLAGRTAAASRGLLPLAGSADAPTTVALVNPSAETIGVVSLEVLSGDGWTPLAELDGLEIRPRRRLLVDLADRLPDETLALRFVATEPVIASYAGPAGIGAVEAIPELPTLIALEQLRF